MFWCLTKAERERELFAVFSSTCPDPVCECVLSAHASSCSTLRIAAMLTTDLCSQHAPGFMLFSQACFWCRHFDLVQTSTRVLPALCASAPNVGLLEPSMTADDEQSSDYCLPRTFRKIGINNCLVLALLNFNILRGKISPQTIEARLRL